MEIENNNLTDQIDAKKFKIFLESEFERRKSKNKLYSLRSFAKQLKIDASCLSAIFRGIRPLTPNLIERFMKHLVLEDHDLKSILRKDRQENQKIITEDIVAYLSQWYHTSILELIRLPEFEPKTSWLAKALDISPTEVQIAVERLIRCDLMEINEKGEWKVLEGNTQIYANDFTTVALKQLQKSLLGRSQEAIENVDIKRRFHASNTIAINIQDIPKAKELLRTFRNEFCSKLQEDGATFNDVYELQISFFPQTNLNNGALP